MDDRFSAVAALAAVAAALLLAACDPQRISELEEGVATEADVRARFGQPEQIWDGPGGARILEYDRQPAGQKNYMITIGPDGRMSALRQVLHPGNFALVQPGMALEDVRKLLGRPAKITPYPLKDETAWDWRYLEPPNTPMVFSVWFNPDMRVLRSASAPDPQAPENR
ncbi:outer membrane protein assembly factor BamE [Caenimonas terrae]|uniref:Outer membrane protein assembly factor BamE n=1 Tax=Caenimonas terrae TaxID=696074 RepID=A0ABW0NDA2_9BURK